jgi:uncharacterized protein (TIRG00374 family)
LIAFSRAQWLIKFVAYDLAAQPPGRGAGTMVRYVLGVLLGVAVLVVLFGERGDLVAARHEFRHLAFGWVAAAVLAEGTSLTGFGVLQRRVLGLAGARLRLPGLIAVSLANEAIANTVPAGPALSCVYRYRFYRQRGASDAGAGWTVFTVLIAQSISMSLFLLLGVVVAMLGSASVGSAGIAAVGLVIVVGGAAILVRRDLVLRLVAAAARGAQRVTGHPRSAAVARLEAALARMREIPLDAPSTVSVVAIAVGVWACDFLCLLCGFAAVHAAVPWDGVVVAYGAAQVASALPIVPGGLGIVEGSLAVILAAYGVARGPAISAALTYRLVSFWLSVAVGWVSVAGIWAVTRRKGRLDTAPGGAAPVDAPALAPGPPALASGPPASLPGPPAPLPRPPASLPGPPAPLPGPPAPLPGPAE